MNSYGDPNNAGTRRHAAVIIIMGGKILLIHRFSNGEEYYVIPGGGIEQGETPEQAAVREAKEETGLDVILGKALWTDAADFDTTTYHFFLVSAFSGALQLGGPEASRHSLDNQYVLEWCELSTLSRLPLRPDVIKRKILAEFTRGESLPGDRPHIMSSSKNDAQMKKVDVLLTDTEQGLRKLVEVVAQRQRVPLENLKEIVDLDRSLSVALLQVTRDLKKIWTGLVGGFLQHPFVMRLIDRDQTTQAAALHRQAIILEKLHRDQSIYRLLVSLTREVRRQSNRKELQEEKITALLRDIEENYLKYRNDVLSMIKQYDPGLLRLQGVGADGGWNVVLTIIAGYVAFLQAVRRTRATAPLQGLIRFIIDGPKYSGKSTLMFGYSHRDALRANIPSLKGRGYECIPEATEEAHWSLRQAGIDGKREENRPLLRAKAAEIKKREYENAKDPGKIYFFDRGLYPIAWLQPDVGRSPPERYDPATTSRLYAPLVFLCAPLTAIDREGVESLGERQVELRRLEAFYVERGYQVLVVPEFDAHDKARNNEMRIRFIENHIGAFLR